MLQLTQPQCEQVIDIVSNVLEQPHKIFAYGSRTKDQARTYSDLDLLIKTEQKLPVESLYKLKDAFEFSDLPFRVDIQDWYGLSESFKENIQSSLIELN